MRALTRIGLGTAVAAATALVATAPPAAGAAGVTVTGRVQVTAAYDGHTDHVRVALHSGGHDYVLRLPAGATAATGPMVTGAIVTVTGQRSGHTLRATTLSVDRAAPAVVTTGDQSVYVIRAYWTGSQPSAPSAATVQDDFTAAAGWFDEVSYGQFGLVTPVPVSGAFRSITGPSDANCDSTDTNAIWTQAVAAEQTATGNAFDPADYDHVAVYFPYDADCSFAGLGDIGAGRIWLNGATGGGSSLDLRVTTHELGHNLGLYHSHSLTCYADGTETTLVTLSGVCDGPVDYGDPADVMGGGDLFLAPHYSASQKAALGWLTGAIDVASPCKTVTLLPYEQPAGAGGDLAASIDGGADPVTHEPVTYWLEYRQPGAGSADAVLPSGLTDGVLLHETDPRQVGPNPQVDPGPDLLDGTPGSDASPGSSADFDDAAIPASTTVNTAPDGTGYGIDVTSVTGTGATVQLTTARPSVPRNITATAAPGGGVKLSWQPPGCAGTGASGIDHYTVKAVGGQSTSTTGTSAVLAVDASTPHEFLVSATSTAGTGAAGVAPLSAPRVAVTVKSYSTTPDENWLHLVPSPSVSDGGQSIFCYKIDVVGLDGNPVNKPHGCYDPAHMVGDWLSLHVGDHYRVTVAAKLVDGTVGPSTTPMTFIAGDALPPSPSVTAPTATTTLGGHVHVAWHAVDKGRPTALAGVQSYDVRYRSAPAGGGFGGYTMPAALQQTVSTSTQLPVAAGSTLCASIRARDNNLNRSGWSHEGCTSRPLDDRALTADPHWAQRTSSAAYAGTLTTSSHHGATLSRAGVHAHHLAVLVTQCPTCGRVTVYAGSHALATLDLHAATTRNRVLMPVALSAPLTGSKVRLVVVTSGKTVSIDGLVVRAV